jgi:hypothetical protein
LAGRPAHAVWAYHCGLRLDPNHRLLRANLEWARAGIASPSGGLAEPLPDSWLWHLSPTWVFGLAALAYSLSCVLTTLWLRRGAMRLLIGATILGVVSAGAIGTLLWLASEARYERAHPVLIVAQETPLYRGNGPGYPAHPELPILARGLEARQLCRRGGWLQVQFAGGTIGWLPAATVLVVNAAPCGMQAHLLQ